MTNSVEARSAPVIDLKRWSAARAGASGALADARVLTINILQWLARIANSYASGATPDDRVTLEFHPSDSAFVTKSFDKGWTLEMRLPTLTMQFRENDRPMPHVFDPEEHSPAEAEAWLLVELLHRGIERDRFSKKLPYELPGLMAGDAEDYSPQSCQQGLQQLADWFLIAATALEAAARAAGADKAKLVCDPRTLGLSCAATSERADFGFSPGDAEHAEPYFYKNSHNANGSAAKTRRRVLTASELQTAADPAAAAVSFLQATAD
jgi:hypothetical protein